MYAGSGLSGANLFKSYVKTFADTAANDGTAQTYSTNVGGVTIAANVAPTISFTPADGTYNNSSSINVTISSTSALYSNTAGTLFTDTTIDNIVTLKTVDADGTDIAFDATISGNTITIDPTSNLADGAVYVAISDAWYYGVNAIKTQGAASNSSFIVGVPAPIAIVLKSPPSSPGNNTLPVFTVTTLESGGRLALYSDSGCTSAVSGVVLVTGNTYPYTVDVDVPYTTDGVKTVYAKYVNASNVVSPCSTASATYELDRVLPTVSSAVYDGTTITVTMSESVYGIATKDNFTVSDDGSAATISSLSLANSAGTATTTVTLTMSTAIADGSTVTLAYSPGSRYILDVAGNTLAAISSQSVSEEVGEPTVVYTPADDSYINTNSANITIDFSANVYSETTCTTEVNATTAAALSDVRVTSAGGAAIAHTATYDATTDTITLDPTSNLVEGAVYVSLTDGWYYSGTGGVCQQGSASHALFTVDTVAPTVAIEPISGGYVNASEDDTPISIYAETAASTVFSITDADGSPVVTKTGAETQLVSDSTLFSDAISGVSLSTADRFGSAVAVSGSKVYVGAYGDDGGGAQTGAVYVFEDKNSDTDYNDTGEVVILNDSTEGISLGGYYYFGSALAVSGSTLYVGAPGKSGSGVVYILEDKNSDGDYADTGENVEIGNATDGISLDWGDGFGQSITVSGSTLYVGATGDDDGATDAGAVYILEDKNSDGDYADTGENIKVSSAIDGISLYHRDAFGTSVAVSGTKLYVGVTHEDVGGYYNNGAVYVLEDKNSDGDYADAGENEWISHYTPGISLIGASNFGSALFASGDTLYVGAKGYTSGGIRDFGAIFILEDKNDDGAYTGSGELSMIDRTTSFLDNSGVDRLGKSLFVSGDVVYSGVPFYGPSYGAVYTFTLTEGIVASLTSAEVQGFDEGTVTVTATATDEANNTATDTESYIYDTTVPVITATVSGTVNARTAKAVDDDAAATSWKRSIIDNQWLCNEVDVGVYDGVSYTEKYGFGT